MTDPIVALLLDRLLPEIEKHVSEMVERRVVALAAPQPDTWMTTTEAAQYLRLSPEALRARVRRGTSRPIATRAAGSSIATNSTGTSATATRAAATLPPDNN